jgi:hypothetical protein
MGTLFPPSTTGSHRLQMGCRTPTITTGRGSIDTLDVKRREQYTVVMKQMLPVGPSPLGPNPTDKVSLSYAARARPVTAN